MALIPKLQGIVYAGSGPGPDPSKYPPGLRPGPGGSEYGGEWEQPITNPANAIVAQLVARGVPPTLQNVSRLREATSNDVTLPRPDRTVEPYSGSNFPNDGGNDPTQIIPKRIPDGPTPSPNGGPTLPPDGAGDRVTQTSAPPTPPLQAAETPPGAPPPNDFLGRDILNLRPLLQLLTTPPSQNTALSPTLQERLGVPVEPPIIQQGQIEGPPKQLALPAPAGGGRLALPAPANQPALPGSRAQPALPAPDPVPEPTIPDEVMQKATAPDKEQRASRRSSPGGGKGGGRRR